MSIAVSLGIEKFAANSIIKSGGGKQEEMALTIEELDEALTKIMNKAQELGMNFLWYSPTRYCDFNPIEKGLGMKQCSAAHIAMAIEPDGVVVADGAVMAEDCGVQPSSVDVQHHRSEKVP